MICREKGTKNNEVYQLADLLQSDSENPLAEILQLGLQQLMELERDDYIGVDHYERRDHRRTSRNGYKPRQLYTRVGTLHLGVPQTSDLEFYPSIIKRYQRIEKALMVACPKPTAGCVHPEDGPGYRAAAGQRIFGQYHYSVFRAAGCGVGGLAESTAQRGLPLREDRCPLRTVSAGRDDR